jgi:hypothetical protein
MIRTALSLLTAALIAVAALAPAAADAEAAPPRIVGSPALTYTIVSNTDNGRFVSVGAIVRLSRRFADTAEQHRYTIVAAPHLRRGQRLADELFGGSALGRVSRTGAWYAGEAVQLRRRGHVRAGDRWQVALARDNRIVGAVKTVRLLHG